MTCAVAGPKILGTATDIIFDGVVGQQIPDGLTQQQAVDALRASGQTQQADLLASLTVTDGVDFEALRDVLLLVAAVYIASSRLRLGPGVHHGRRLAADRLPDAPRRRPEALPSAAALLRQPSRAATR